MSCNKCKATERGKPGCKAHVVNSILFPICTQRLKNLRPFWEVESGCSRPGLERGLPEGRAILLLSVLQATPPSPYPLSQAPRLDAKAIIKK